MEFIEFLNARWRKELFRICVILAAIGSAAEIVIYLYDAAHSTLFLPHGLYRVRFIYIPSFLNLLVIVITYFCIKSHSLSNIAKNTWACLLIYFLCANTQVIHYVYGPLLMLPTVAIFVSILFSNKKITMLIWGLSNVSLVLAYRIASGELRKDDPQLTIDTLLAALVMSVSLIGAMLLIGYVSEQMNYILASNTRQKQLIEECNMDALMGIANRRALNSKLSEIVEKSPEKPYPILLMLDIDNFKKVNDTFGHVCGDEVLMTLAGIIKSSINGRKINAYRFGGEEIVILFEEYDKEDAYKEADSIRKTFSNVKYPFDQKLCVTFSAGMAEYENGFSADRWVVKADERLYMAKNDGKNRIHA